MSSPNTAATLDRLKLHDQALDILRHTNDGDELDSHDLALLQNVVNSEGKCLTPTGVRYWSRLHERTGNGSYQKQPFCGVRGLHRDHVGYVYWKGVLVEHYSHKDHEQMVKDARVLGAICKSIENRMEVVAAGKVMEVFAKLRFGEGSGHMRFLAIWRLYEQGPRLQVIPLSSTDQVAAEHERKHAADQAAAHWSTFGQESIGDIRSFVVCTKEQYDALVQGLQSDCRWGWQRGLSAYGSSAVLSELLRSLEASVDRMKLPTKEDLEEIVLGQTLCDVITESERTLEELQHEMLGELPVERAQ